MIPPMVILALASLALGFAVGWVLRGRMAGLDEPREPDRRPDRRAQRPPPWLDRPEDRDTDVHP